MRFWARRQQRRVQRAAAETWEERDLRELREEYNRGELTLSEFGDGLDDIYGIHGGIGHSRYCMIDLPSGTCTCGGRHG